MATYFSEYNTGKTQYTGGGYDIAGHPRSSVPDIITQIAGQTRNNTRDLTQAWLSGSLSLEDWISALQTGTSGAGPVFDPSKPPQVNTGQGYVSLGQQQISQLQQGKSLEQVLSGQQQTQTTTPTQSSTQTTSMGTGAIAPTGQGAQTLSTYYSQRGQALPPRSQRAQLYQQLGLGNASTYSGSATQNTQLLQALQKTQATPISTGGAAPSQLPSTTGTQAPGLGGLDQSQTEGLNFWNFTPQQISQMSQSDLTNWALMGEYLKKQTDIQGATVQANVQSLNQAYRAALNDPQIAGKYSDIQQQDIYNFQQQLQAAQQATDLQSQQQQTQFGESQRQLAEQEAQAGRAFSGFRTQAEQKLAQEQQAVIQSSKAQLQQQLSQGLSGLQARYGTTGYSQLQLPQTLSYLNPLTGQRETISPALMGGTLQGTLPLQKQADISSRAQQIYSGIAPAQ